MAHSSMLDCKQSFRFYNSKPKTYEQIQNGIALNNIKNEKNEYFEK